MHSSLSLLGGRFMQIIAESAPLELSGLQQPGPLKPNMVDYNPRRNYLVPVVGRAHTNDKRSLSLFNVDSGFNRSLSIRLLKAPQASTKSCSQHFIIQLNNENSCNLHRLYGLHL